jgi:hypothetical protein
VLVLLFLAALDQAISVRDLRRVPGPWRVPHDGVDAAAPPLRTPRDDSASPAVSSPCGGFCTRSACSRRRATAHRRGSSSTSQPRSKFSAGTYIAARLRPRLVPRARVLMNARFRGSRAQHLVRAWRHPAVIVPRCSWSPR